MLGKAIGRVEGGLGFKKDNIENWSSPPAFDIVFSNAALQWCSDHPQIFFKMKNALKPRGQLAVQMPMNHDYATHTLATQMSREEPWLSLLKGEVYAKHKIMLAPEEYAALMFQLGFETQKVFLRVYNHLLVSREDVIEWVKGTMLTHFKSRLGSSDYQNFMKEYSRRLFEILPDQKPFFYPFKRILIWGRL